MPNDPQTEKEKFDSAVQAVKEYVQRANLASEVYLKFYDATESFQYVCVGSGLAYLMGAILTNGKYGMFAELDTAEQAFYDLLEKCFPDKEHAVWSYVEVYPLESP